MELEQHEIRMTYHSLLLAQREMKKELATKKGKLEERYYKDAEQELKNLTEFIKRVESEYKILIGINPFTYYSLFFPEITESLNDKK